MKLMKEFRTTAFKVPKSERNVFWDDSPENRAKIQKKLLSRGEIFICERCRIKKKSTMMSKLKNVCISCTGRRK